ncbi:MAG: EamA family transporter [Nanoarchaeota archaeon]
MNTSTYIIIIVLICAFLGASGQMMFKLASEKFSFNPLTWIYNWYFIVGILLYGSSAVLFIWSLKHGNLSILYPVIATSYIWVSLLAIFFLKEPFPPIKWLGIILIILGVIIITR